MTLISAHSAYIGITNGTILSSLNCKISGKVCHQCQNDFIQSLQSPPPQMKTKLFDCYQLLLRN